MMVAYSFRSPCQTAFNGQDAIFWKEGKFVNLWAFGINWHISLIECRELAKDISAVLDGEWEPVRNLLSRFRIECDEDSGSVLITQDHATIVLEESMAKDFCKWLEEVTA